MTIVSRYVDYTDASQPLKAFMAWDDAVSERLPAVLVSHAWGGRSPFENSKAEWIAGLGYVGFALDCYGAGVLGSSPEENAGLMQPFLDDRGLLLGRLRAALDAVRAQPEVDPDRVAIMGFCFGGLCALDLARSGADIRGAVSIHGLFNPPPVTHRIGAKVLALHGWEDPMAKPDSVLGFADEMTRAGADWQVHAYGRTVHAFTNPAANDYAGGMAYNADADRRAFESIVNFLEELFEQ